MKEFSCKNECGSNCCDFTIIDKIVLLNHNVDIEYLELHNIEVKEIIFGNFKKIFFKIPLKCKWFKNGKCFNYKNRPFSCKVGHGNNEPFKIEGCGYGNDLSVL